jgi:hypothetical protein
LFRGNGTGDGGGRVIAIVLVVVSITGNVWCCGLEKRCPTLAPVDLICFEVTEYEFKVVITMLFAGSLAQSVTLTFETVP